MYKLLQDFFKTMNQEERMNMLAYFYETDDCIMGSVVLMEQPEDDPEEKG